MGRMLWSIGSSSPKQDRGRYLIGIRIQQGCLIVFAQVLGLDAWLNYLGSIYFLVLGGPTIGPDSMYKLILSGSQVLITGIPIGLWVKILWGGYIEDMMKRGVLMVTSRITLWGNLLALGSLGKEWILN